MYAKYIKRPLDFIVSLCALFIFSPVLIVLTVLGWIKMKGNPFFTQLRPGKNEKLFKLIKFRTMTCQIDENGNLLPDAQRLTRYGKILRSTSLDELPELINILKGDMSIIGPRPLLVEYLPLYDVQQRRRHEVRPGLSGLAQIHGRNTATWEEKFAFDVQYVDNITFIGDVKLVFITILKVIKQEGISQQNNVTMESFKGTPEKEYVNV